VSEFYDIPVNERDIFTHMRAGPASRYSQGLRDLIADCLKPGAIVAEIGVYAGESTRIFMESGLVSELWAVDIWQDDYHLEDTHARVYPMRDVRTAYFDNIEEFRPKVLTFAMPSLMVAAMAPNLYFDLVYIDANHGKHAVMTDINSWSWKVKRGGYIAGHDYQDRWPSVIEAIDELLGGPDKVYQDTSWVKQL
jgi:hypothetical protein